MHILDTFIRPTSHNGLGLYRTDAQKGVQFLLAGGIDVYHLIMLNLLGQRQVSRPEPFLVGFWPGQELPRGATMTKGLSASIFLAESPAFASSSRDLYGRLAMIFWAVAGLFRPPLVVRCSGGSG
jgi:hypothetical protein